jgi:WD40 repeat protein
MNQSRMFAQTSALLGLALFFGSASVVHAQKPKPLGTLKHGPSDVTCLLFSKNGDILVSQCLSQAQALRIWDTTTKKITAEREGSSSVIVLSPDGKTLASGGFPPSADCLIYGSQLAIRRAP